MRRDHETASQATPDRPSRWETRCCHLRYKQIPRAAGAARRPRRSPTLEEDAQEIPQV